MQNAAYFSGWIRDATSCPSPNFNARPMDTIVNLLVIHSISLPPGEFGTGRVIEFFQNQLKHHEHPFYAELQNVHVSAHFFIERTGQIVQCVSTDDRAWHAGISIFDGRDNCNDYSIGIEMEGCDNIAFAPVQYQSLINLTRILRRKYPAISPDRIVSHAAIALPKGRKTDPGPCFDWAFYLKNLSLEDEDETRCDSKFCV